MEKYYIPAIEDIHIGYECEFHGITTGGLYFFNDDGSKDEEKSIEASIKVYYPIRCGIDPWSTDLKPEDIYKSISNNQIRTPYLTKEQIEAEGWENSENIDDDGAFEATKSVSGIIYKVTWTSDLHMQIFDTNFQYCVYYGTCPSINEFRTICKLLNIK